MLSFFFLGYVLSDLTCVVSRMQACSAIKGDGLNQGLEWITNHIRKD